MGANPKQEFQNLYMATKSVYMISAKGCVTDYVGFFHLPQCFIFYDMKHKYSTETVIFVKLCQNLNI